MSSLQGTTHVVWAQGVGSLGVARHVVADDVEGKDRNVAGRLLRGVGHLVVVPVQGLQVVDDVHPCLEVVDASEVHLDVALHRLPGILHVVHQGRSCPDDALGSASNQNLVLNLSLSAGTTIDIKQGWTQLGGTSPADSVVGVDGMALGAVLLIELLSFLDVSRRQNEVFWNVTEVTADLATIGRLANKFGNVFTLGDHLERLRVKSK
mmetsp:Transcript_3735/g.5279  ORF Transcript_3735/g.5279 Transcript_3735/m.5279 type:complete len:208 (-) Transcript_3735:35-658(-)